MSDTLRHQHRQLSEEAAGHVSSIKDAGDRLLVAIDAMGPSREASIARTKVEEAVMWAVKAATA